MDKKEDRVWASTALPENIDDNLPAANLGAVPGVPADGRIHNFYHKDVETYVNQANEELTNLIESEGITLDAGDLNQVEEAVDISIATSPLAVSTELNFLALTGLLLSSYAISGANVRGLTYRASDNVLFEADSPTGMIYLRDATTGAAISSYATSGIAVRGLTYRASDNVLFEADSSTDLIYLRDATTGAAISSYAISGANVRGLTYRASDNVLFEADSSTDLIYLRDATTGAAISSYATSGSSPTGLAYRASDNVLFEVDEITDLIYLRDATTGAAISSYDSSGSSIHGLALAGSVLIQSAQITNVINRTFSPIPIG